MRRLKEICFKTFTDFIVYWLVQHKNRNLKQHQVKGKQAASTDLQISNATTRKKFSLHERTIFIAQIDRRYLHLY